MKRTCENCDNWIPRQPDERPAVGPPFMLGEWVLVEGAGCPPRTIIGTVMSIRADGNYDVKSMWGAHYIMVPGSAMRRTVPPSEDGPLGGGVHQYRKKPVEVSAIQWTGHNNKEVRDFTGGNVKPALSGRVYIDTLEGRLEIKPGDYIIRGVKGEYYPCKPDIFEATYEAVE